MVPAVATRMDVRTALKEAMARLRAARVASHTLAAELLLMHALGRDRAWLYTHPEEILDATATERLFSLVARRAAGEPAQYLTGRQEFWGMEFEVTPAVLIPRPETEHLVEVALDRLGARGIKINMATGEPSMPLRVADVGTGSGCLAVALARELPHATIVATDISAPALEVAQRNAARHGTAEQIEFVQTDLLAGVLPRVPRDEGQARGFDLIVSNPPYIPERDAPGLQKEVREHEPGAALFGGESGVEIYARLIEESRELLRGGGIVVMELGHDSLERVGAMMEYGASWLGIRVTNDLAGIPRVISAVCKS
ncbi:MAG TPA: peptide chain release factor N(5)-glutamine methyltransferase [Verrucomicrobiae bacterium]|nr:peptide chain release factor N(5)-glutamine methyltransferase [Verrucomicrobiae bacterium]